MELEEPPSKQTWKQKLKSDTRFEHKSHSPNAWNVLTPSHCPPIDQVYGGKVNGSILAGRNFLGRESGDVGSALVFGDSVGLTRRVMGILDACYPFAHKAGLLVDEQVGLEGPALGVLGMDSEPQIYIFMWTDWLHGSVLAIPGPYPPSQPIPWR